ncbi:MAG: thioredoxin domain-containing protein [Deltaproteobacteria bacterium]|jgi:uncharacterized protein YyaL (SSP411 family)
MRRVLGLVGLLSVLPACSQSCRASSLPTMTTAEKIALPGADPHPDALAARMREALAAQGRGYVPRTHHLEPGGAPKYTNRLIFETSPYLLQHAHNPVNWFAWGDEAFALAKTLGRPVLLSVGYSTCHWCHVMERESFEDEEIAAFINQHFVAIKVDREERPDVDSVYMTAVQLMTGRGGWPMTVVMTPDRVPFFGGTYFPARDGDRGASIGFLTLLRRLAEAYATDQPRIAETARRLTEAMNQSNAASPSAGVPGDEALTSAAALLVNRFDPEYGGFGRAPKFPRPSTYELLLRYWRRTGDDGPLHVVRHSLDHMKDGGIYDHVGGGFARYSTDAKWLVPHFEKMLYDNAQLVAVFTELYQATNDAEYERVTRDVLDYVLREMTSDEGGFFSATDADSEGEEGKFFVWSPNEIREVVGAERAKFVEAYYGVTDAGNFEGHNILAVDRSHADVARELGVTEDALRASLAESRKLLYEAREKRIHPLLDDKVLVEWNAQMLGAMARAGFVFAEPKYVAAAKRAADFIESKMTKDGRLLRAYRAGHAKHSGVLEDHAFLVAALIDVFEATGEIQYLERAIRTQSTQDRLFRDDTDGAYFSTPSDGEALLVREKPIYDGAQPSGNSVTAMNLLRLGALTSEAKYVERADAVLKAFGEALKRGAAECPKLASALDFRLDRAKEVVIVEAEEGSGAALIDVVRKTFVPNRVLTVVTAGDVDDLADKLPVVEGKRVLKEARATAYVCFQQSCQAPTSDPTTLEKQLLDVVKIQALPLALP